MSVSNKKLKKAIYRLKVDGKTPVEVIDFIYKNLVKKTVTKSVVNTRTTLPTSSVLNDSFNGIMNNVSLNCGNSLLIKRTYKILCDNYLNIVKKTFPMSYDETNQVIKLIRENSKLQAVKLVIEFSKYGLKDSKFLVDELSRHIVNQAALESPYL